MSYKHYDVCKKVFDAQGNWKVELDSYSKCWAIVGEIPECVHRYISPSHQILSVCLAGWCAWELLKRVFDLVQTWCLPVLGHLHIGLRLQLPPPQRINFFFIKCEMRVQWFLNFRHPNSFSNTRSSIKSG